MASDLHTQQRSHFNLFAALLQFLTVWVIQMQIFLGVSSVFPPQQQEVKQLTNPTWCFYSVMTQIQFPK